MTHSTLDGGNIRWSRALSRWALGTGLALLGVLITFGMIMTANAGGGLPPEYDELAGAMRMPALYRVAAALDVASWLGIGGFFMLLAVCFARRAPVRALILAGCGVGQLAGAIGAWARLTGVSALAAQYAVAAPGEQSAVLRSFLDLQLLIGADFATGSLLWSIGLLLAASAAWQERLFPRWLAVLLVLTGACNLVGDIMGGLGMPAPLELFVTPLVLLIASLFGAAIASRKSRPLAAQAGREILAGGAKR
jgi:hypothetical protein